MGEEVGSLRKGSFAVANPFDIFKQQMRERGEEKRREAEAERLRHKINLDMEEMLRRLQGYQGIPRSNPWAGSQQATSAASRPRPTSIPAWCKVLGLPPAATQSEIKSKYRKLALEHHPDKGGDAATFNKINEAYKQASRR